MSPRLEHRLEGPADAPVLMLSNSIGARMDMWDDQAPALAERYRLLRYDTRGHGGSDVPPGPYSIEDVGRDALGLLDALGIERAHFCGLSLGGMTGMWLGINAPERVDRLVLACTSAHMPPGETWDERAAAAREDGMADLAEAAMERWLTPHLRASRPDAAERIRRGLQETPGEGYAGVCEAIREHDLRAELPGIAAPTLVIAGDEDPSAPPEEHGRLVAEAIPGARMVVLEHARHLANVEHPEEFTRLVVEHLEGDE